MTNGRRVGIYHCWTGPSGARVQVDGYPGSCYKKFSTRVEAEQFMRIHWNDEKNGDDREGGEVRVPVSVPDETRTTLIRIADYLMKDNQ